MTQANRDALSRLAAEFSGCVSSRSLEQRTLPPYCIRTDLVKIKERQASASELFRISKPLCRKGFPFQRVVGMLDISLEIRQKQTNLPMGELRLSELTMIDKEILYMVMKIQNKGIFRLL